MDNTVRAGAWIGTLNNPTEEERVSIRTQQRWLKSVKGQDEIGQQGTLHIQFVATTDWIRLSALKRWLPRAHFEPCRGQLHVANASNYVHKEDTGVPGTRFHFVWRGDKETLSTNKVLIALYNIWMELDTHQHKCILKGLTFDKDPYADENVNTKLDNSKSYYFCMGIYLQENPEHVNVFGNRMVKELWVNCQRAVHSWWETDRQTTLAVNLADETPHTLA